MHSDTHDGLPLVVDLDRTLLRSDTLYELILVGVRRNARVAGELAVAAFRGKAALKHHAGRWAAEVVPSMPADNGVLSQLEFARREGRKVVLATASGEKVAGEAERRFGPFAEVLSSSVDKNLKGPMKARALVERFGDRGFDYIGDSFADVPIFRHAQAAYLARPSRRLEKKVQAVNSNVRVLPNDARTGKVIWRLMRPHQWAKNLLLVVPVIGAQEFSTPVGINLLLGFVAFSAVASALYIVNDLLDIQDDRRHTDKQSRPLAAGDVSIPAAAFLFLLLLTIGISVGTLIGLVFVGVLLVYGGVSATYSFWLKRIALVDVFVLAGLYGIRVIAGAVAPGLSLSLWLLSFSFFIFLSLAFIKRFVEIARNLSEDQESLNGRDYRQSDRELVVSSGVGTGAVSSMLLALYIEDRGSELSGLNADLLWLTVPLLLYWILRVWFLALRGRVASDPVLFALRDRVSLVVGFIFVILFTLVSF